MRIVKDKWVNPDHIGHKAQHRVKPMSRAEIVCRHVSRHCVHIFTAVLIAYLPVVAVEATRPEWGPIVDQISGNHSYSVPE